MPTPKILSVDDSRMVHTLVNKAFAPYEAQVVLASNGAEALEVASRETPDVILLDVTMPVMDGVECLSRLKADPLLKDIPVIMLTAEAGKENVLRIAKMGVRDYIVKPFTEAGVIERVTRIVDLKPRAGGAPAPAAAPSAPAASAPVPKKNPKVTDAINILVVDEHPAILETIQSSVAPRGWKAAGCDTLEAATKKIAEAAASKTTPDVVLVSLAYPNKAAIKFLQATRTRPEMKNVPMVAMAIRTATFEQTEARDAGFDAVLTKPLEAGEIADRLAKAMELDLTPLFFTTKGDCAVVTLPADLSDSGSIDLSRQARAKVASFANAGIAKLVIDLGSISKPEVPVLRAIGFILNECNNVGIKWRVAASDLDNIPNLPNVFAANSKVAALKDVPNPFKGASILDVSPTLLQALSSF
jgi:two-component system cell cycle response regulator